MSDSLVLARLFELLGGGVPSTLPQCAGAVFHLGSGYDIGTPQPVNTLLVQLMGDGERPTSWRVSNRTVTLPVTIIAPDRFTLAAAREMLLQAITFDQFDLVWSPDGTDGTRNTIYECFRAKATTISYGIRQEQSLVSVLAVTFDALPYGRSDVLAQLNFDSPIQGVAQPASPITVDDFSTVLSSTQATLWTTSIATPFGTQSAKWQHSLSDGLSPLWYTHTITATDITGFNKLTFWLGLSADSTAAWRAWPKGIVHFAVTLTDNLSRTITMSLQQLCGVSLNAAWPKWNRVSVPIPQGATFSYNNVTSYSIKAWSEVATRSTGKYQYLEHSGFLAGLLATPTPSPKRPASDRGGEYVLYGIEGTAPTPLNLHLQLGFQTFTATTKTIDLSGSPGSTGSYVAPPENPNWLTGDTVDAEGGTVGSWISADGIVTNGTLAASSTFADTGTFSIRVTPTVTATDAYIGSCLAANVLAQGVPCASGDRIAIRVRMRNGGTARNIYLGAEFFTAAGASLGAAWLTPQADTGAFTTYQGRVTALATSAFCRMLVRVGDSGGHPVTGEFHYFDNNYHSWAVQAIVVCRAAGAAGGSTKAIIGSAGGGGGGEIAWETNLDLNPGIGHSYTRGAGGSPKQSGSTGNNGGNSQFVGGNGLGGTGTTVLAHGGIGGTNELTSNYVQGAGGNGGSGSTNTHHFNGGNGGTGTPYNTGDFGGGGGGSAGDGGAGGNASGQAAGGNGAAGSLGLPGAAGSPGSQFGTPSAGGWPGAGGGGTSSYGSSGHLGAYGGNGQIRLIIKTYTSSQSFPMCLVHKLSDRAKLQARAVLDVGAGQDPPDGREYGIDDVDGVPARYEGTYTVLLIASSLNGATARTITVTVRQYEAAAGAVSTVTAQQSITPSGVTNGVINLGEITLPVKQMSAENIDSNFTVSVVSGNTADRFLDLLLIDTSGQLVLINLTGGGYSDYYFDAPSVTQLVGLALGTDTDRTGAVSVMGSLGTIMSGGPMQLTPGDNVFTVYATAGMPGLEGDYWPRWQQERLI